MSFSPEIFNKKLGGLLETQDSIVTISQWILFHHRHSKDAAKYWSDYVLKLGPSSALSSKKLSLLYLCNDVVQQARHKRKTEFISHFADVLPQVLNLVFPQVNDSIKPKISRLVDVWEQRSVFPAKSISELKRAIELSKQNKTLAENEPLPKPNSGFANAASVTIAPELNLVNTTLVHINSLDKSNQGNLQQISIQSKTYLPSDPSNSDNLPSPKIYLSKLNILEKLCNLATSNIDAIKKERTALLAQLENLSEIVRSSINTDESKKQLVDVTLHKLKETKGELQEMIEDDYEPEFQTPKIPGQGFSSSSAVQAEEEEEPSPSMDIDMDEGADDDDDIPKYENSDDDEAENSDIELPLAKKQKTSRSPSFSSGASTPSSKKSVAFSEDVEIKEYDREERTEYIQVHSSNNENISDEGADEEEDDDDIASENYEPSIGFESHHKDSITLKHQSEQDEYQPITTSTTTASADIQNDVLSILSKLAQ